jgi:hypothetical protein
MPRTLRVTRRQDPPGASPQWLCYSGNLVVAVINLVEGQYHDDSRPYECNMADPIYNDEVMETHGRSPTLDEAKAAVLEQFSLWLKWAGLD